MKKLVNKKFIMVTSAVLFFSTVFALQVFAFGGHGRFGHHMGMRGLVQLDLDKTQKAEIANIIEKLKPEMIALRDQIQQAREKRQSLQKSQALNEDQVRQAFQTMNPLLENMFVLRAKMRNEIRTVLTEEQIDQIEEKRAQRWENRGERRKFRHKMMETWLEMEAD
ncbi:MAG: Spy/CpxP family protein refolding chaperone [Thermodesulfobacteriota bacterium]|nr:Spy/CpxP family protein refolding chaperone [Thermodesulfobacteriota bacterium]